MAEGKTPGNGAVSPFGDSKGATQAAGGATGAHDFVTDPAGSGPGGGGGRDFTKESRPQPPDGPPKELCVESIPAGGRLPFPAADAKGPSAADVGTQVAVEKHKPFKLNGA
jgi:hypothetical protein